MNHLLSAPLFFFLGGLVCWLFFVFKIDRSENLLLKLNRELHEEREALWAIQDTLLSRLKTVQHIADIRDKCLLSLTEEILKYQQQEKQKCSI